MRRYDNAELLEYEVPQIVGVGPIAPSDSGCPGGQCEPVRTGGDNGISAIGSELKISTPETLLVT